MDVVNFSTGHVGQPRENAQTLRYGGHSVGWVVSDTDEVLASVSSMLSAGPYTAFDATTSDSSLDVTIGSGEAAVSGTMLARDVSTTVSLGSNVTDATVYVGWAESAKDTVIIGTDNAFSATNPKIPLWSFDTDGSGVTASTDERDIDEQVEVKNTRYEGGSVKVDRAVTADQIGGISIGQLLRGDQDDSTSGALGITGGASLTGTVGSRSGERLRLGGGTSDFLFNVQGGHGRVMLAWNAYYDDGTSTWRSIIGGEGHAAIGLNNSDPGTGTDGSLTFATAKSNSAAGDEITWQWIELGDDGDVDLRGTELEGMRIENRYDRPSNPDTGRIIYRNDKD